MQPRGGEQPAQLRGLLGLVDAVEQIGGQFDRVLFESGAETFTNAARLAASSPAGQARATDTDSWRNEITRAHRSPTSVASRRRRRGPERADHAEQQGRGRQDPLGTAALEAQLGGDLLPAVADLAEDVGVGDDTSSKVTSLKWCSPSDCTIG